MIIFALAIALASSTDCFASGLSYGINKIRIPLISTLIVVGTCTFTLVASIVLGKYIIEIFNISSTQNLGAIALLIMGIYKLISYIIKVITNKKQLNRSIKFSLFSLSFIINICNQPNSADIDNNKSISSFEAVFLAIALSIDGIAMGISTGLTQTSLAFVATIAGVLLLFTFCSITLGCYIGTTLSKKTNINLGWLSGILLIGIALYNIFS